jgi:hypothetical protein
MKKLRLQQLRKNLNNNYSILINQKMNIWIVPLVTLEIKRQRLSSKFWKKDTHLVSGIVRVLLDVSSPFLDLTSLVKMSKWSLRSCAHILKNRSTVWKSQRNSDLNAVMLVHCSKITINIRTRTGKKPPKRGSEIQTASSKADCFIAALEFSFKSRESKDRHKFKILADPLSQHPHVERKSSVIMMYTFRRTRSLQPVFLMKRELQISSLQISEKNPRVVEFALPHLIEWINSRKPASISARAQLRCIIPTRILTSHFSLKIE